MLKDPQTKRDAGVERLIDGADAVVAEVQVPPWGENDKFCRAHHLEANHRGWGVA